MTTAILPSGRNGIWNIYDWEFSRNFALAKNTPANSPNRMLMEFSMLVRTLKRRIPAMESGILLREPTRLYVVALV